MEVQKWLREHVQEWEYMQDHIKENANQPNYAMYGHHGGMRM